MEMSYDNSYRKSVTKLGAFLICRAANLHGPELENLTGMLVFCFTRKHKWNFHKAGGWASWFPYTPGQECRP